jgi:2,3-dihydroxybenzoate decarboxylase
MGETLPFLLWRFDSRWQCELGKELSPDALPSAIIRRNFVITTSGVCAPGPLAEAIAALGEDSVMFSVDNIFDES